MNLAHIFTDIPILIVLSTFVISTLFCLNRYFYINKNLKLSAAVQQWQPAVWQPSL